jgi:hypothetical protein
MDDFIIGPTFAGQQYDPGAKHLSCRRRGCTADALEFLGLGFSQRNPRGDAWHAQEHSLADYNIKH